MASFKPRPTGLARSLRNNATPAERLLWVRLSRRQLAGYKFIRQMPVAGFVCDLMCREAMLIIEVDGGQHDQQSSADERRTKILEREGFRVLRFWNNEIIENIEGVAEAILVTLRECPPLPLPLAGGENESAQPRSSLAREGKE
jgi:very-short-patch-repair endonuclease